MWKLPRYYTLWYAYKIGQNKTNNPSIVNRLRIASSDQHGLMVVMVLLCCRACNPSKLQIRGIWLSSHSGRKNRWVYETLNSDSQKITDLELIHNHGSRKTKGINQRNLDPESPFLWNLGGKNTLNWMLFFNSENFSIRRNRRFFDSEFF